MYIIKKSLVTRRKGIEYVLSRKEYGAFYMFIISLCILLLLYMRYFRIIFFSFTLF